MHLTLWGALLQTGLPSAPASWRCRWRPSPPQLAYSSPKYLGLIVISFLSSCQSAKAQGGGFVWAAVSLSCEHSCGTRQDSRLGFFTVFSFQLMRLNGLQLLQRDVPCRFSHYILVGVGVGQPAQLEQIKSPPTQARVSARHISTINSDI